MNTNYNEIDKNNYNEYIEKILNIYRLSSKDSSILFNIKIENYKCYCSMSIIGRAGDKQEFSDVILDFDDKFYPEFLDILVTKINNEVRIKVKDIVNLDGDSLVAYRMVTDNNDLFTIDGLEIKMLLLLFLLILVIIMMFMLVVIIVLLFMLLMF